MPHTSLSMPSTLELFGKSYVINFFFMRSQDHIRIYIFDMSHVTKSRPRAREGCFDSTTEKTFRGQSRECNISLRTGTPVSC